MVQRYFIIRVIYVVLILLFNLLLSSCKSSPHISNKLPISTKATRMKSKHQNSNTKIINNKVTNNASIKTITKKIKSNSVNNTIQIKEHISVNSTTTNITNISNNKLENNNTQLKTQNLSLLKITNNKKLNIKNDNSTNIKNNIIKQSETKHQILILNKKQKNINYKIKKSDNKTINISNKKSKTKNLVILKSNKSKLKYTETKKQATKNKKLSKNKNNSQKLKHKKCLTQKTINNSIDKNNKIPKYKKNMAITPPKHKKEQLIKLPKGQTANITKNIKQKNSTKNKKTQKLQKTTKASQKIFNYNNKYTKKQQTTTSTNNEYIIGPGDVLDVEVWKEPQLSAKVPVRPDGKITLPLINDIQAAGRTPLELRAAIQKALSKFLENPVVSVSVLGVNKKFFILGKVKSPGEYPLNTPITVLQAIALARGFADWADKKHIIILRQLHGKQIRLKFNYEDVAQGKHLEENIYLKPGDTIIVP